MSVNKVILVGNLGSDPEAKTFDSGTTNCKFSMATSEKFKDKSGEKQEKTTWHNVIVWGAMANPCEKYLKKGSKVYIEGKIDNRSYEKDGEKKYITEVIAQSVQFLDSKSQSDEASSPQATNEELGF